MKILVVESEETTRNLLGVMLKQLGYKVGLVCNCADALRAYKEQGPHDIVLIAMKFMRGSKWGGPKLIDDLLAKNPQQQIAFVTGSPILQKPFRLQDVDDFMGAFRRPADSRFD